MDVSISRRWARLVEALVKDGEYDSASEVVQEGLRLLEEREAKLASLRETIQSALAEGGSYTAEEVLAHAREGLEDWKKNRSKAAE